MPRFRALPSPLARNVLLQTITDPDDEKVITGVDIQFFNELGGVLSNH